MRIQVVVPDEHVTPEVVEPVLEAVTRVNQHMLATGQTPTSHELIKGGAVWRPENMGDEHFDHGGTIAQRGWGDCDDWAPLHAATLRQSGEDPGAKTIMVPSGPNTFHAIVQRSNGQIEDPSIAAGMKSSSQSNMNVSGEMQVYVCDPHDGRIYQGAMAPTVGPLSVHCGPGVAVRGCHVIGGGMLYEGRVDLPIAGSSLSGVRGHLRTRHHGRHRSRVIGAALPYAIATTHVATSKAAALRGALCGAIVCGDTSGLAAPLDRYKLLAMQYGMAGHSAGQTHAALMRTMHADIMAESARTGVPPEHHARALRLATATPGSIIGGLFDDIADVASSVVSDVSKVVSTVANVVPWGDIIHGVEAAVSLVPGLGTAVSDVLATAETAYNTAMALLHGNPLEAGIRAAYNYALASVPGAAALRFILDPIVTALINLTVKKEPVGTAVLDSLLASVPDAPKLGPISPRSIAATLAHLIVSHLGVKNTGGGKSKPASGPPGFITAINQAVAVQKAQQHPAAPPPRVVKIGPLHVTTPPPPPAKKVIPLHMTAPAMSAASGQPKPPGAAHAATHKLTLQSVNPMVQHV
jgi:hypothetical protein